MHASIMVIVAPWTVELDHRLHARAAFPTIALPLWVEIRASVLPN
jgi:hypothetical protein